MKVRALSLRGILFEGDALSLNVKTTSGEITVLNHHRPLVSVLSRGVANLVAADGTKQHIPIESGFLEMSPENELTLLID